VPHGEERIADPDSKMERNLIHALHRKERPASLGWFQRGDVSSVLRGSPHI
jgi:hypothetical protein